MATSPSPVSCGGASGPAEPSDSLGHLGHFRRFLESIAPSAAQAWLRHIDVDGRGVSFTDFCRQLPALGYKTDVAELWSSLGGSATAGSEVALKAVDAAAAARLAAVAAWCQSRFADTEGAKGCGRSERSDRSEGAVMEAFLAAGGRCCGSVAVEVLAKNLKSLGCPVPLSEVQALVDPWDRGTLCAQDFFVLEQDGHRRQAVEQRWRLLTRPRSSVQQTSNGNAQELLSSWAKQATALGGRHWTAWKAPDAPQNSSGALVAKQRPERISEPPQLKQARAVRARSEPRQASHPSHPNRPRKSTDCAESAVSLPKLRGPDRVDADSDGDAPQVRRRQARSVYCRKQFQQNHKAGFLPMLKSVSAVVPHWGQPVQSVQGPKHSYQSYRVAAFGKDWKDQMLFEQFEMAQGHGDPRGL
ncbi:unnamed protein product [Symbiodinium natans]|uniref:Uncharacterized protein n=1 Tax=Symbiodinium natans TaxID=878477 RepID=A0A812J4U0_9DINO|nr:unnamed protein product [Symbiodinium natans]